MRRGLDIIVAIVCIMGVSLVIRLEKLVTFEGRLNLATLFDRDENRDRR